MLRGEASNHPILYLYHGLASCGNPKTVLSELAVQIIIRIPHRQGRGVSASTPPQTKLLANGSAQFRGACLRSILTKDTQNPCLPRVSTGDFKTYTRIKTPGSITSGSDSRVPRLVKQTGRPSRSTQKERAYRKITQYIVVEL